MVPRVKAAPARAAQGDDAQRLLSGLWATRAATAQRLSRPARVRERSMAAFLPEVEPLTPRRAHANLLEDALRKRRGHTRRSDGGA
jgi:hypothetical protein